MSTKRTYSGAPSPTPNSSIRAIVVCAIAIMVGLTGGAAAAGVARQTPTSPAPASLSTAIVTPSVVLYAPQCDHQNCNPQTPTIPAPATALATAAPATAPAIPAPSTTPATPAPATTFTTTRPITTSSTGF